MEVVGWLLLLSSVFEVTYVIIFRNIYGEYLSVDVQSVSYSNKTKNQMQQFLKFIT